MKVLIVGGGGREHALAWKISQSPCVTKIFCAPGNAGIAEIAECIDIGVMEFEKLAAFAKEESIDLTVVGMDDPLIGGITDAFGRLGLRVFGPDKKAALLEGSKAFSKEFMKRHSIPTASYESFSDPEAACRYLCKQPFPIVLKADGQAAGKGVLICSDLTEAGQGIDEMMRKRKFGNAGRTVVIEEFLTGHEVSVLAFADGRTLRTMSSAQDHKRALDGDRGLNTGGMGAFSPSPFYTEEIAARCEREIFIPTIEAMAEEGRPFKGVIFFGLMLTSDGPKLLEYNVRFGDPETQVVLPRMKNDLVDVMESCIDGTLDKVSLDFSDEAAVCVILASEGYPTQYDKGKVISGLSAADSRNGCICFHAGTKKLDADIVTNGGRVIGVTALDATLGTARDRAYEAARLISFDSMYMRSDIAKSIEHNEI